MTYQHIISQFPSFSMMQESVITTKIQSKCIMGIPAGESYFAWFIHGKCYLLTANKRTCTLCNAAIAPFGVPDNTIFYGVCTQSTSTAMPLFCIENVYYFDGNACGDGPISKKWYLFKVGNTSICESTADLKHIRPLIFGLPVMHEQFHALMDAVPTADYPVEYIQFSQDRHASRMKYTLPSKKSVASKPPVQKKQTRIFWAKADLSPDHYCLYTSKKAAEEDNEIPLIACIPDYKTSVYMNSLFRKIKENKCLDALEESDDEDEFENVDEMRFIESDLCLQISCQYNTKFKAWMPCH